MNRLRSLTTKKNQVRCKGKITEERGHPIHKAHVSLIWALDIFAEYHWWADTWFQDDGTGDPEPDDQGNFSAHGLWPGRFYYLRIKARGFENWAPPNEWEKTKMKTAECEETIDFGTTVIKKKGPAQVK